jgi:hypothetical protein
MAWRNRGLAMLAGIALSALSFGSAEAQSRMFDPGIYPTWPDDRDEQNDSHWVMDERTQCLAFDSDAGPDDRIIWTGGCHGGRLFGFGTLTFYDRGRVVERLTGMFDDGVVEDGRVHIAWADGSSYDGMEAHGNLNGEGIFVDANGRHFDGTWENGNFKGPRLASIPDRVQSDAITPLIGDTPQEEAGVTQETAPKPIQSAHAPSPAAMAAAPATSKPDDGARKRWAFLLRLEDAPLVSVDGSRLTLKLMPNGQLRRTITRTDGSEQILQLAFLNDRLGTARDGDDHVVATFRATHNAVDVMFQDGHAERLIRNGPSLVVIEKTPGAKADRARWYPEGHAFSQAEKKAALAQFARDLSLPAATDMPAPARAMAVRAKAETSPTKTAPDVPSAAPPQIQQAAQNEAPELRTRPLPPALAALIPKLRPFYRPPTPEAKTARAAKPAQSATANVAAPLAAQRQSLAVLAAATRAETAVVPRLRPHLAMPPKHPLETLAQASLPPKRATPPILVPAAASSSTPAPKPAAHVSPAAPSAVAQESLPAPSLSRPPAKVPPALAQIEPPTASPNISAPRAPQIAFKAPALPAPKIALPAPNPSRSDASAISGTPPVAELADASAATRALGAIRVVPQPRPVQPEDATANSATPPAIIPPRRTASNCLSVESDGLHWGFRNHCSVDLQFAYCVMKGLDRLTACGQSVVPGSVAAKGFGALMADTDLKRPDASHAFRWVACVGGAGEVVPHLDQIEPAAGRCLHAGDIPPDTERAEAGGSHPAGNVARGR